MIKTGLLCVPAYDEAAVDAVRRLLHRAMPALAMLADRHVESRRYLVEEVLRRWCDEEDLDLILTIGGTLPAPGPSAHEIVPEATHAVLERALPGLPEAMRAYASEETPLALLDRSTAGIRGRTVIVNLPAGEKATALFLAAIVDVLPAVIAHLQEASAAPSLEATLTAQLMLGVAAEASAAPDAAVATPAAEKRPGRTLDATEFATFLQRSAGKADPGAG
ncbi:MAG TPA: molybdopterin-binding protein [Caldilinea sp.]|nr:molybdopterin-binding protein [Caldilinea sp.]